MAKKDTLIKNKSIYTIRNRHATTNKGVIYENDYVTIKPNDGIYNDEMTLFSDSIFKYKVSKERNGKRRHIRNEVFTPQSGKTTWTGEDLDNIKKISEESKIVLKPNYSSLNDFAYFGSAKELIKATMNDIILRFPGGISYYGSMAPTVNIGEETYYLVSNEFEIDFWTIGGNINYEVIKNPLRCLSVSYSDYVDKNGNALTSPPIITYNHEEEINKYLMTVGVRYYKDLSDKQKEELSNILKSIDTCPNTIIGTLTINDDVLFIFLDGEGKRYLITDDNSKTGVIIKPKEEIIEEFWDTLDDFERILLNRDTTPVYKATFEVPFITEDGFFYESKSYIWPTVADDNFTPDLTTGAFQGYLESLITLADFHDTYDSDNIWRMMTHESIKNLDWTFISRDGENSEDLSDFDSRGIGAMIRIYGRLFDDIKRNIDNIKYTNTITYDEKNNIPDYFLTDIIENDGWDAEHTAPFGSAVTDTINNKYKYKDSEGNEIEEDIELIKSGKTCSFVNSTFLRRLGLSSDYILSMKGTRRGIEAILNMFGYIKETTDNKDTMGTYSISEYVAVVSSALTADELRFIRNEAGYYDESEEGLPDITHGYPVAVVLPNGVKDEECLDFPDDAYVIPWFDKEKAKGEDPVTAYYYPFYFQGKGGWGKVDKKTINTNSATTLDSSFVALYGETKPYMKFALTIDEMLSFSSDELVENIVCYVVDISNIEERYKTNGETIYRLKREIEKLNATILRKDKKIQSLENCTTVANLENELNNLKEKYANLQSEYESVLQQNANHSIKTQKGKNDISKLRTEYNTLMKKYEDVVKENEEMKRIFDEIEHTCDSN